MKNNSVKRCLWGIRVWLGSERATEWIKMRCWWPFWVSGTVLLCVLLPVAAVNVCSTPRCSGSAEQRRSRYRALMAAASWRRQQLNAVMEGRHVSAHTHFRDSIALYSMSQPISRGRMIDPLLAVTYVTQNTNLTKKTAMNNQLWIPT